MTAKAIDTLDIDLRLADVYTALADFPTPDGYEDILGSALRVAWGIGFNQGIDATKATMREALVAS